MKLIMYSPSAQIYSDDRTDEFDGDVINVIEIVNYQETQLIDKNISFNSKATSTSYDCPNEKYRINATIFYSGKYGDGNAVKKENDRSDWTPTKPAGIAYFQLNHHCTKKDGWKLVAENADDSVLYLNHKSYKNNNDTFKNVKIFLNFPEKMHTGGMSLTEDLEIDCKQKNYSILNRTIYSMHNLRGDVIQTYRPNILDKIEFREKDSMYLIFKYSCS